MVAELGIHSREKQPGWVHTHSPAPLIVGAESAQKKIISWNRLSCKFEPMSLFSSSFSVSVLVLSFSSECFAFI